MRFYQVGFWCLAVALAFLVGRGDLSSSPDLAAQGRGRGPIPDVPTRGPDVPTGSVPGGSTEDAQPLVYEMGGGNSGQANGLIAVTGSYGVGTSVLYLIDAVNRQIAVYEARGGSSGMRRIVLVGARRIDLDLQLENYNDDSEFDYAGLQKMFANRAKKSPAPVDNATTGLGRGR